MLLGYWCKLTTTHRGSEGVFFIVRKKDHKISSKYKDIKQLKFKYVLDSSFKDGEC